MHIFKPMLAELTVLTLPAWGMECLSVDGTEDNINNISAIVDEALQSIKIKTFNAIR